jgi:hypothetical protein
VNDNPNGTYVKLTVCTRYTFICKTSGSGFWAFYTPKR